MLSDQQNRQEQIHDCPCNKHPAFLQNHPEIFKATKKITSSVNTVKRNTKKKNSHRKIEVKAKKALASSVLLTFHMIHMVLIKKIALVI